MDFGQTQSYKKIIYTDHQQESVKKFGCSKLKTVGVDFSHLWSHQENEAQISPIVFEIIKLMDKCQMEG